MNTDPLTLPNMDEMMRTLVRKHQLAVNDLTENQLAEALRQAMPDFRRNVHANGQSVVYFPGQEADRWRSRCNDLERELRNEKALADELADAVKALRQSLEMMGYQENMGMTALTNHAIAGRDEVLGDKFPRKQP